MLGDSEVIPYLLEQGLLDRSAVVDGDVRVLDGSRRNRIMRVMTAGAGPSFLLKLGVMRDGFSATLREATAYRLLHDAGENASSDRGPTRLVPWMHLYDESNDVLVLELVDPAVDLRRHTEGRRRPSVLTAVELGRALAALHRLVPSPNARRALGCGDPGVLMASRPGVNLLRDFSAASIEMVRMIQASSELVTNLAELRSGWRSDGLIHQDLRWDNVLICPSRSGRRPSVVFVDWETAAVGDPAWDLGSLVGDYLSHWLNSIPSAGRESPDQYLHLAAHPLNSVQPAVAALWNGYRRSACLSPAGAAELLVRLARYSGLKLVQSALEQVQRLSRPTVSAVCHLQVALNMMARPNESARVLLGLGMPS